MGKGHISITMDRFTKEVFPKAKSQDQVILYFPTKQGWRHFGWITTFKEREKYFTTMDITMMESSNFHRKRGKEHIDGKIKRNIKVSLRKIRC